MKHDLTNVRHIVLDMDGTIYLGGTLFPETRPFLAAMERLGIGVSFVTNNCTRSRAEYAEHLHAIGVDAEPQAITTSAQATIHYLETHLAGVRRLFVLGTRGLCDEFRGAGFEVADDRPDAVVVGFDTGLDYERLCRTAYWISRGLPYVATHPDRVCPTDKPTVLPDCGAICALLESATGRRPEAVPGKPSPAMLEAVATENGVSANEIALVGDRLYTDIRMARDAGAVAVLTLTGETTRGDVEKCAESDRPDMVIENLGVLARVIEAARSK